MATSDGWYLIGPLIAVGLVGFLGAVFWRMGLPVSYVLDAPRELNWARDGLRLVPATGIVEATWAIGHRTSANSVSENSRSYNESI